MALATVNFFSEALEVGTSMTVVLPQPTTAQIGVGGAGSPGAGGSAAPGASEEEPPPLLYLLHGLSDDHTAWLRYTSIERYATAAGLAVVMPAAGRSFYTDEAYGHPYWQFVSEELPDVVARFLRVTDDPARTFVAGLSMGGYGALKLALSHPWRYGAAASLSGAVDVRSLAQRPERAEVVQRVFAGRVEPDQDLFALVDAVDPDALPPLYVACGTGEDRLMAANERLVARLRDRGADVATDYRPGTHEWGLWDATIPDVIDWLPTTR